MPRKPKQPPIACEFFSWRLFRRDGVYYAGGRGGKSNLGKSSLGTRERAEAFERLKLLDRKKAIELGLADEKTTQLSGTVSIADGWKLHLDYGGRSRVLGGVSPGTLRRYKAVRDKHLAFSSEHRIENWNDFDRRMIEKYGNRLSRSFADRTVFFELTLAKSIIKWLITEKKLPAECKIDYPLRKPQGSDTYCYSRAEVWAMIKRCSDIPRLVWLANVIIALVHTGMRISELAGLRWSDIDFNSNTIRVADERSSHRNRNTDTMRTTKGRRSRSIPIHPRLRQLLGGLKRKTDGRVFHAARGGMLCPNNVLQLFICHVIKPLKAKFPVPRGEIGFDQGRLHSFRHVFCSQAFLGGASEGEIRQRLGHADSKMVEYYRHLRNEDAQRKMEQINFMAEEGEENRPPDAA